MYEEFMHVFQHQMLLLGSGKGSECLTNEKYHQGLLERHKHTDTHANRMHSCARKT